MKLRPEPGRVTEGVPEGGSVQVLADPGRAYGVYLRRQTTVAAFSARWSGALVPPATGTYQIHITSNDGVRVKTDGRVLFEDWTTHATKTDNVPLALTAGVAQSLVAEYFYSGGSGVMRLAWTRPDGVRETIPASAWRQVAGGAAGVKVAYFHALELTDTWFADVDPAIDHDFGSSGPTRKTNPFASSGQFAITLERGTWAWSWLNPVTGESVRGLSLTHPGGVARVAMPAWTEDIAIRIRRDEPPASSR